MTLGQEIKYYRKKNGLTQTAFGDLFGMQSKPSTLGKQVFIHQIFQYC